MTQKTKSLALTKKDKLSEQLKKAIPQLEKVATKFLKPERMVALAMRSASKNPKILDCTPQSILGCVFESQTLGLEIDSLGQGYIVPFKDKAQFIIGYRGLINLAQRTGNIASIHADLVRNEENEKGHFVYQYGVNADLSHRPILKEWDAGFQDVYAVYAYAKLKDGGFYFVVLPKAEIEKTRLRSPSGRMKDSPWNTHWDEMAKKTAIRKLAKYLPMSIEFERAVKLDEMTAEGEQNLDINKVDEDGMINLDGIEDTPYEEDAPTEEPVAPPQKKPEEKKGVKAEEKTATKEAIKLNMSETVEEGLFKEAEEFENWESPQYCVDQIEKTVTMADLVKLEKEHKKDFDRFGGADAERIKSAFFSQSSKLRGI